MVTDGTLELLGSRENKVDGDKTVSELRHFGETGRKSSGAFGGSWDCGILSYYSQHTDLLCSEVAVIQQPMTADLIHFSHQYSFLLVFGELFCLSVQCLLCCPLIWDQ